MIIGVFIAVLATSAAGKQYYSSSQLNANCLQAASMNASVLPANAPAY